MYLNHYLKDTLIPLGLTAAASATDEAIQKKMFGSGVDPSNLAKQMTLIILNEEMNDIRKIVKSLQKFGLLIKDASKTKMKQKNKKEDFSVSMLFST